MFHQYYRPMYRENWQGRIDSRENFLAFRWHQWIRELDLRKEYPSQKNRTGFAFLGFKSDEGIRRNKGRPGASKGPDSIRRELANLPCYFSEKVQLFDAGDILCENGNLEESQQKLSEAATRLLELNLFPIVLGGGHEIALGHYRGIRNMLDQHQPKSRIGIFNLDAHFDLRPYPNGGSSGTMFRQIADENTEQKRPFSYFCAGVQRHSNTIELFKTAQELGVQYLLAKDMARGDHWQIIEKVDFFVSQNDSIYLTICSDVFSTAFAPGVSAAQPLGVDPELVLKMLKRIISTGKVISFDIAEVSPRFDQDHITASLAKVIIFTVVNMLCSYRNQLND